MPFNINEFIARGLPLGGARPSLFEVNITFPTGQGFGPATRAGEKQLSFVCNASSIPASIIAAVDVPYFGRKVKVSGDRTFDDWDVTIMNDENYIVRRAFEEWHSAINSIVPNLKVATQPGESAPNGYKGIATVNHYGKRGDIIAQYQFVNIFPTTIQNMGLDWNTTNTIQSFDVRFAYDYWLPYSAKGSDPELVTPNGGGLPLT
jgi:hypothetical protein